MKDLLDWVKANVKEGVDLAGFESLAGKYMLAGDAGREEAIKFINGNKTLKGAFDAAVGDAVKTHDEKFTSEKLPSLLEAKRKDMRAELMKELNPDETPEQKRIRELEEKIAASDKRENEQALKAQLRAKAKELGYDVSQADRFYVYGEDALAQLEADHAFIESVANARVEAERKLRYGNNQPPQKGTATPTGTRAELIEQYNTIEASNDPNKGVKLIALKERIAKIPKE